MQTNAYARYKDQSLSTMAPGELLVKLYDELIKQCRLAVIYIQNKDLAAANNSLMKSQTIVSTLDSSLDMRFPISKDLHNFYLFFNKQLRKANLEKNVDAINELLPLMKDLRDSFAQAEKLSRSSQHGGKAI